MNRIAWTSKAVKQLGKLDPQNNAAVRASVNKLDRFPDAVNVKCLSNHTYGYRLRVGNYRVLFDFDGAVKIVSIEEVKKRDERTY